MFGGAAALVALPSPGYGSRCCRSRVHEEPAAAEGVERRSVSGVFVLALRAVTIAIAIKIVGVLLIIAFLIMPAAAARPAPGRPSAW